MESLPWKWRSKRLRRGDSCGLTLGSCRIGFHEFGRARNNTSTTQALPVLITSSNSIEAREISVGCFFSHRLAMRAPDSDGVDDVAHCGKG